MSSYFLSSYQGKLLRDGTITTLPELTTNPQHCTVTWSVLKLEAPSKDEEEVLSGRFSHDVCCMCGGRIFFPDGQTEHFIKHTDEVWCRLCQMNFSHMYSLDLHLKNVHPKDHIFCNSCNIYMRQYLPKKWTVDNPKMAETLNNYLLKEEVEEVMIENEEVEIKYMKEEDDEVVVGEMVETLENSTTLTPEDNKMINSSLHDHTYCSTQMVETVRKTTNNVVMYTSSENVLVFINNTDSRHSESDQQATPVDDHSLGTVMHDHTYFSIQSLADHKPSTNYISAQNSCCIISKTPTNVLNSSESIHVLNNKGNAGIYPKDPERTEHDDDQSWKYETVCSALLDHNYFTIQNPINHTVLSQQVPSPNTCRSGTLKATNRELPKHQTYKSNTTLTDKECAELESSQLEYNKVEDDLCELKSVSEDEQGIFSSQERSSGRDYKDSDFSSTDDALCMSLDDVTSDTTSCVSSGSVGYSSNKYNSNSESCGAYQKKSCENTKQKLLPLDSVDSGNSNPATSLCKYPPVCNLSKVHNTEKSRDRCTSITSFICSLCGFVFGTAKLLLNHQAVKHPLAKYMCVKCWELFPNQYMFIQHVCGRSKEFSRGTLTQSNSSINAIEQSFMLLDLVPSSSAVGSSKQPLNSPRVHVNYMAENLGSVSMSKSHSLSTSLSTSATQNIPVQVMATRSSGCFQQNKVKCLNGDQGQVTTFASSVTQKQIGHVQVLSPLQTKVVTQTTTTTTTTFSPQVFFSPQGQGLTAPVSTVTWTKIKETQALTPLRAKVVPHPPELATTVQQHPSLADHIPHSSRSQGCSSVCLLSQTGQHEASIPFLDIHKSPFPQILSTSPGPLKIVAMFLNQSKELALQKRMCQSWRSKTVFPCRQCGVMLRQFSLGVRHRYQHRGPRLYRCQCGRAFQQRMHLLRHQVQHAESTRYVCAACGQMFNGTQQLACHRPLVRITASNNKKQATKECRNRFQCYCGYSFTRPAALLWHILKNSKARKPHLKHFS